MLQTEEKKSTVCPLFQDHNNDIAGPCVPSPIRGLIFDVGSTLFTATRKDIKKEMENAMKQTLSTYFKWTSHETQLFWSHYLDIQQEYDSKKLYVGTGSIYDYGSWPEPSIKSWIIEACLRMNNNSDINETDPIYDDAIKVYRTPRVNNAKLIPNVVQTITELRDKYGIKSAICSNDRCASRLRELLKKHKLLNSDNTSDYFDIIMISAEIGKRKPDIRLVLPILTKWKRDYNIVREEIIFVGDKLHTDIQVGRYLGLRTIHCNLYNRHDIKYKLQKKREINPFRMRKGTYLGAYSDHFLNIFNAFHANYNTPDYVLKDYCDFVAILKTLAGIDGVIKVSDFNVFAWRALVIGVLLRPEKIAKFRRMRLFEIMEYRKDIIYKAIDVTGTQKEIALQGPFDIILHKLNWYYFNAKFDVEIDKHLQNALKYLKTLHTNINIECDMDEKMNDKHLTYISDEPSLGVLCQDRWYVYNTINNANIAVNNMQIKCPKTILITFKEIKELQLAQREGVLLNDVNNKLLTAIKCMRFPLYFKPRTSGRTATKRYDGHCLYIIPCLENIYCDKELFHNLLKNENGDWILQEYIDHLGGCHKVYNLGYFVFASINHSTPTVEHIMQRNENIQINSTGISSKHYNDQSIRDQLSSNENQFYQQIACQLKHAFNINLFGFDMIFDTNSKNVYVVDLNFMPSFKIVENFHTILTEYLLYEYYHFIGKYRNK